jgi:hypothetical protein
MTAEGSPANGGRNHQANIFDGLGRYSENFLSSRGSVGPSVIERFRGNTANPRFYVAGGVGSGQGLKAARLHCSQ